MKSNEPAVRGGRKSVSGTAVFLACVAMALVVSGAQAQTTGTWNSALLGDHWTNTAFWAEGAYPNGVDATAIFVQNFTNNRTVSLKITNSVPLTLNALVFSDTGADPLTDAQVEFKTSNGSKLTFDGPGAYIVNSNSYHSWITFASTGPTVVISNSGLRVLGNGGVRFGVIEGYGDLHAVGAGAVSAIMHFVGSSPNYHGTVIATNGGTPSVWGTLPYAFGSTNSPTVIYDSSYVHFADRRYSTTDNTCNETFILRGVRNVGSLTMNWSSNMYLNGTIRLETNGVIRTGQERKIYDFLHTNYISGKVEDDGGGRNFHLLSIPGGGDTTITNGKLRLSPIALTGAATYGGYTHLSGAAPDIFGNNDMYLIVQGSDNRLPVGTTLLLGGGTNDAGVSIGDAAASGILIVSAVMQELAGIKVLGSGTQNRVIGGSPTFGTLALNIASGTNLYAGRLGDNRPYVSTIQNTNVPGTFFTITNTLPYQDNLNLVKKGAGVLELTAASNTYAGTTTVEAGTLRISGDNPNPGAITVQTNGTLIVNGDWRASGLITVDNGGTFSGDGKVGGISSSGTVSPGNSPGILTSYGDVTLSAGATLQIEINEFLGDDYDKLVLSGGALSLSGSPDLAITLNYLPGMGDAFTIVSGMTGFDPGFDGTFSGKPDLGTFDVSGTTFQIDYSATDITLTVVPEPHTLGLLGLATLGGLLRRRIRR